MNSVKLGVLFCGRQRPGFNPGWGEDVEKQVRHFFESQTRLRAFYTARKVVDVQSACAAVDECRTAECEALVILQPTMSDGRLGPVLAQRWGAPLVLWGTAESADDPKVSACSLVGAHTFGATLAQLGRPILFVYGMPGDERCHRDLEDAVFSARTWAKTRQGRIGLIGRHSPGYIDMDANPGAMTRTFGTDLHYASLHEYLALFDEVETSALEADVKTVKALGLPMRDVDHQDLEIQSRYYLALKNFVGRDQLDAVATRCWPELSNKIGHWPYLAFLRLCHEGVQAAMEGDADGALTCWIGDLLGMGPGYLSDWLSHDDERVVLWHPGNAPFSLCPPVGEPGGPVLAPHFNIPKPMVVEASLLTGLAVTLFRYWQVNGTYFWMAAEAEIEPDGKTFVGTCGTARVSGGRLNDRLECWIRHGFPHHIAVCPGHHLRRLDRFARLLGIQRIDI